MTLRQLEEAARTRAMARSIWGDGPIWFVSLPERKHGLYRKAVERYGTRGNVPKLQHDLLKLGVLAEQIAWHVANRGADPLPQHSL